MVGVTHLQSIVDGLVDLHHQQHQHRQQQSETTTMNTSEYQLSTILVSLRQLRKHYLIHFDDD
jgi:hypothetical protein